MKLDESNLIRSSLAHHRRKYDRFYISSNNGLRFYTGLSLLSSTALTSHVY